MSENRGRRAGTAWGGAARSVIPSAGAAWGGLGRHRCRGGAVQGRGGAGVGRGRGGAVAGAACTRGTCWAGLELLWDCGANYGPRSYQ